MTIDEARTQLAEMFGAATIPDAILAQALQQSLTWDAVGLAPGQPGYVETYDLQWAAAEACTLMALTEAAAPSQAQVKTFTSEGTTVTVESGAPVDWWHLAHLWRCRSKLGQLVEYGTTLGHIDIPVPPVYIPTSNGLRW